MSDNIPFEIQTEIIKRVPDVKSLIRFRAVSRPWKSFIDSSDFIASYDARHTARHTNPHSFLLFYQKVDDRYDSYELKYKWFVDDDNDASTQQQGFAPIVYTVMQLKVYHSDVIGCSGGLLCMHNENRHMVVLCNPFIRKSVRIVASVHYISDRFGFGVCPVTNDPTIVRISYPTKLTINSNIDNIPWHVEVFTLSSGVWSILPCSNLPRGSITLDQSSQVVISRFIYWVAYKRIDDMHGHSRDNYMIMSFDLSAKQFRVIHIPDGLKFGCQLFSISKLMESLVLFVCGKGACDVWKMEHDGSFAKLFTINTPDNSIRNILGFRKNGELVMETQNFLELFARLEVYKPCSKRIKNLGIRGLEGSFFMGSYKETLLLLDHADCCVYHDINDHRDFDDIARCK